MNPFSSPIPSPLNWTTRLLVLTATVLFLSTYATAQRSSRRRPFASPTPSPTRELPGTENVTWLKGPSTGQLGDTAAVKVPEGFVFAGAADTRTLMEAMQNPATGQELGFVAPADKDWFVVFEFDEVGYVKDDEKDSLDADAMLESIRASNEEGNKERARRGWAAMTVIGWEQVPHYNASTNNLEWAIRGASEGNTVLNFNTRILGRGGVMKATLVADPTIISTVIPEFKSVLAGFNFNDGKRYNQFAKGDKIAEYGLSALIVGGATAVAVKSGLFKWLWKAIVVGVIAISGFIKRIFSRRKTE